MSRDYFGVLASVRGMESTESVTDAITEATGPRGVKGYGSRPEMGYVDDVKFYSNKEQITEKTNFTKHSWKQKPWERAQQGNAAKKKLSEKKLMANKFLPFIVEKSTPTHIYQTLLSRSKGMNMNLITSVFYLVCDQGVKSLREYVKTLDDMPLEQLYETLLNQYSSYRIDDIHQKVFTGVANYIHPEDKDWPIELNEFDIKDTMSFLLVMVMLDRQKQYTQYPVERLVTDREKIFADIQQYVHFSNTGTVKEFKNVGSLKSFILYCAVYQRGKEKKYIKAVLLNAPLKKPTKKAPDQEENEDDIPF